MRASRLASGAAVTMCRTPSVRRRLAAGLRNLFSVYMDVVDAWTIYDNVDIVSPHRIASGRDPGRVCPDDLNTDTGRERPGSPGLCRPRCAEAGSLTPLSTVLLLFCGRPGRQKAPAETDADTGASIGNYEALQPRRMAR